MTSCDLRPTQDTSPTNKPQEAGGQRRGRTICRSRIPYPRVETGRPRRDPYNTLSGDRRFPRTRIPQPRSQSGRRRSYHLVKATPIDDDDCGRKRSTSRIPCPKRQRGRPRKDPQVEARSTEKEDNSSRKRSSSRIPRPRVQFGRPRKYPRVGIKTTLKDNGCGCSVSKTKIPYPCTQIGRPRKYPGHCKHTVTESIPQTVSVPGHQRERTMQQVLTKSNRQLRLLRGSKTITGKESMLPIPDKQCDINAESERKRQSRPRTTHPQPKIVSENNFRDSRTTWVYMSRLKKKAKKQQNPVVLSQNDDIHNMRRDILKRLNAIGPPEGLSPSPEPWNSQVSRPTSSALSLLFEQYEKELRLTSPTRPATTKPKSDINTYDVLPPITTQARRGSPLSPLTRPATAPHTLDINTYNVLPPILTQKRRNDPLSSMTRTETSLPTPGINNDVLPAIALELNSNPLMRPDTTLPTPGFNNDILPTIVPELSSSPQTRPVTALPTPGIDNDVLPPIAPELSSSQLMRSESAVQRQTDRNMLLFRIFLLQAVQDHAFATRHW